MGKACRVKHIITKRKRKGFCGNRMSVSVNNELNYESSVNNVNINNNSVDTTLTTPTTSTVTDDGDNNSMMNSSLLDCSSTSSSSLKKVKTFIATIPKEIDIISGNRFIDMSILSNIFSFACLLCPDCKMATLRLGDRMSKREDLASIDDFGVTLPFLILLFISSWEGKLDFVPSYFR